MEPKTELQRNALASARRKELDSFQRALDVQWLNSRMEDGRMGRCLALIQREAEMEKDFQERTDHAAIVNAQAERETALGIEIAKVRREEACELLRRHYLRERDPTLRALTKKLHAGYVCRDLKLQIQNNEYRRLQEKAEERRANLVLSNALYNDLTAKEKEDREKFERSTQYCKDLQQQLVNRQQQRQCQYEDTLIEKKMLDDIMRTISDEDQRELKQKREQTEKMRREMAAFEAAREAWRDKQRALVEHEEARLHAQRQAAADRSLAIVAERERKMRIKEELNQKITAKILADEAARLEREDIIKALQEQEYLEKNSQDDIAEKKKLDRVRSDTKDALTAQMDARNRAAADQRAREAEYRKETEAKMQAEDEKAREKDRQRREKNQRYAEELQKQIQDNARRRRDGQNLEHARAQYVCDYDKAWQKEVAEERRKIVEEHAPQLIGYLQAGSLAAEDLPALRDSTRNHDNLASLDIDSLDKHTKAKRHPKCNAQCRIIREY